ncbi:MAG: hypothetical protein JJE52_07510 [Acidimicrobiia bacterium]|nr:hypothetical protein [Acidimicrobiia bacterium]
MSRPRFRWMLALLAAAGLLAAGCGDDTELVSSGDGGSGTGEQESDATDPVLLVEVTGAFTTPEMNFQNLPHLVVYPDGRMVQPGAQIMIYPGPALPALNVTGLSGEALEAIAGAARAAGLDRNDVDYGEPPVADAGTTVVTVVIDGETYVHSANALGLVAGDLGPSADDLGLTNEQVEARQALEGFLAEVGDPSSLPGAGESQTFSADRFRLWARPVAEVDAGVQPDADEPRPTTAEWTVEEVELSASDCIAAEGDAADAVASLLADANTLTRFESGGETWAIVARPVLPHEPTCVD